MHMSGSECDRCSHEHAGHRYGIENNADPGVIPDELKGILNGITQMEEMLCSLASPCFIMWVSKGGQYKARGNVITFSQDVSTLCTVLPRLPEELDALIVRKTDSQTTPSYKDFRVQTSRYVCLRTATCLTMTPYSVACPACQHIAIPRVPRLHMPLHTLPPMTQANLTSNAMSSHKRSTASSPLPSEQDAISSALHLSGLTPSHAGPLPWPPTGPALSEYTTCNLFTMAFPTLFPLGVADPSEDRPRKLELHEWVKHLMRYR
ncbi:hypothetical protein BJV77DRAFT_1162843 [Russula vinacea]|nr:hypothetical protein BJV77DRAFT_1162843 [Russula vinacea]